MNNYQLIIEKDHLVFRTSSFKAEKTSVLHSGVYTREFSSMLSASAVSIAAYFIALSFINTALLRYLTAALVFALSFILSLRFVFREQSLEVDFNRQAKTVVLVKSGILKKREERIPYEKITSIEIGNRKYVPENPDGIDFVQKISAQHGSSMPGLSDEEEFVTLSLRLSDGSERTIFAGKVNEEPSVPINEIRNFFINKDVKDAKENRH